MKCGAEQTIIHSSEFYDLKPDQQLFSLARAYLEAGIILCDAMILEKSTIQFANSRVILHLCRHAVELFLKAAIKSARQQPKRTHDLSSLYELYKQIFTDPDFDFDVPFRLEAAPPLELSRDKIKTYHAILDQRYRYPVDSCCTPFYGPEALFPEIFLAEMRELDRKFDKLQSRIEGASS